MKLKKRYVLLLLLVVVIGVGGWVAFRMFGPAPRIAVSEETTRLTQPLADDGLPDYATWMLDQQREGVTAENNAAVPFLQAMWSTSAFGSDADAICKEIGMEVPEPNKSFRLDDNWHKSDGVGYALWKHFLARQGIDPESPEVSFEQYENSYNMAEWDPSTDGSLAEYEPEGDGNEQAFSRAANLTEFMWTELYDRPWTREQFPPLAEWVDEHADDYDLLHEAARRERYYFPSASLLTDPNSSLIMMLLPDVQEFRGAARLLGTRAMMHLGEQNHAAAWADVEAIYKLADHLPPRIIIEQLVRIAMHGIANSMAKDILASDSLDLETARAIHAFFAAKSASFSMAQALDEGERLMFVTTVLQLSGERGSGEDDDDFLFENLGVPSLPIQKLSFDWNIVLREGNRWYDRLTEIARIEDFEERQEKLAELDDEIKAIAQNIGPSALLSASLNRESRSKLMSDLLMSLLLPASGAATNATDRAENFRQVMHVAAALAVYRCENGEYPDSLDALVPDLLPELPKDFFAGAPLAYTKTAEGYLLVNLGANGMNDGGSSRQLGTYKGVSLEDVSNAVPAMEFLGEEIPRDEDGEMDWMNLPEIPDAADDIAIRVPQPPKKWPELPAIEE